MGGRSGQGVSRNGGDQTYTGRTKAEILKDRAPIENSELSQVSDEIADLVQGDINGNPATQKAKEWVKENISKFEDLGWNTFRGDGDVRYQTKYESKFDDLVDEYMAYDKATRGK